jgi:hypothetical protein
MAMGDRHGPAYNLMELGWKPTHVTVANAATHASKSPTLRRRKITAFAKKSKNTSHVRGEYKVFSTFFKEAFSLCLQYVTGISWPWRLPQTT